MEIVEHINNILFKSIKAIRVTLMVPLMILIFTQNRLGFE
jgi:hypothetical protein